MPKSITLLFKTTEAAQVAWELLNEAFDLFVEVNTSEASLKVTRTTYIEDDFAEIWTDDFEDLLGIRF